MLCWSVRDPWAIKKFPPFQNCKFDPTKPYQVVFSPPPPYKLQFSQDDQYLLKSSEGSPNFNRMFDLKTGQPVFDLSNWLNVSLHPYKDWLLQTGDPESGGRPHRVLDIVSGKELFRTTDAVGSYAKFSENGDALIIYEHGSFIRVFQTSDWKLISTFALPTDETYFAVIDHNKTAVLWCNPPRTYLPCDGSMVLQPTTFTLKAIQSPSNKILWEWKTPFAYMSINGVGTNESTRRISCEYDCTMDTLTHYFGYDGPRRDDQTSSGNSSRHITSPAETWTKNRRYCLYPVGQEMLLLDGKTLYEVSRIYSPNGHRADYIGIAGSGKFVAGVVDNSVTIWTPRRLNSEWWGIAEQPEFWLASLLFIALTYSIWRDQHETRNAKPETTSNPASTSPAHH